MSFKSFVERLVLLAAFIAGVGFATLLIVALNHTPAT